MFPNAIVKQTDVNLGVARKQGFELVDSKFVVYLMTIELCDERFNELS